MKNSKFKIVRALSAFCLLAFAFLITATAQEQPPTPGAPKNFTVPVVKESKLPNGLTVAVVERKNVPLVTVQLVVKSGAEMEGFDKAGLANMTAELLTKGTKTRTATQIAEQMEFLGGSINTGAGWNNSLVTVSVMSDKLDQAMAIMADVVLNPAFKQEEIDLLKSQKKDELAYNLKQPGFLANYVASAYSFREHPAGGTLASLEKMTRRDIEDFYIEHYSSYNSVLIFTGDISPVKANQLAAKYFGKLPKTAFAAEDGVSENPNEKFIIGTQNTDQKKELTLYRRILVVDLPNSGQAAVNYLINLNRGRVEVDDKDNARSAPVFYPALVTNAVLGGGYSARLNQEIRIKRGLSYGAGSSFAWRQDKTNFGARTQTKDESAAVVAELIVEEIKKLMEGSVADAELMPRKLTLLGDFGRELETNGGLANALAAIYTYDLPTAELNSHMRNVNSISQTQIKQFASTNLKGGDLVIVGDYAKFKDDLAKRFPNARIEVVEADKLDLSQLNSRK